jgi:hypothetical protein
MTGCRERFGPGPDISSATGQSFYNGRRIEPDHHTVNGPLRHVDVAGQSFDSSEVRAASIGPGVRPHLGNHCRRCHRHSYSRGRSAPDSINSLSVRPREWTSQCHCRASVGETTYARAIQRRKKGDNAVAFRVALVLVVSKNKRHGGQAIHNRADCKEKALYRPKLHKVTCRCEMRRLLSRPLAITWIFLLLLRDRPCPQPKARLFSRATESLGPGHQAANMARFDASTWRV